MAFDSRAPAGPDRRAGRGAVSRFGTARRFCGDLTSSVMAAQISTPTAGNVPLTGTIVVAPHHFPDLDREHALADEFGIELVATPDVETFRSAIADAAVVMITPYATLSAEDFPRMRHCLAVVCYG